MLQDIHLSVTVSVHHQSQEFCRKSFFWVRSPFDRDRRFWVYWSLSNRHEKRHFELEGCRTLQWKASLNVKKTLSHQSLSKHMHQYMRGTWHFGTRRLHLMGTCKWCPSCADQATQERSMSMLTDPMRLPFLLGEVSETDVALECTSNRSCDFQISLSRPTPCVWAWRWNFLESAFSAPLTN